MWFTHFLQRQRQRQPDALALADEKRQLTWTELDDRTEALACGLLARGAEPGDRIAVCSRNRLEVVEVYLAAAKAGLIVCPINPTFPAPEVQHIMGNVSPIGVLGDGATLQRLGSAFGTGWQLTLGEDEYEQLCATPGRLARIAKQDDIFAIVHTSATTGRAKGVALSNRAVAAGYTAVVADFSLTSEDVLLYPCPLFHGSMIVSLALLAAGGTLVIQSDFTPQRFLANIERFRPTLTFVVPSMVHFTMQAKAFDTTDLSSLRELIFGGSPMPEPLLAETLDRFGIPVRSSYGLSEAGPIASARYLPTGYRDAEPSDPPLCSGRMHPGCHIEVLDSAGNRLPYGEDGEICVRNDGSMSQYWQDEVATAAAFQDGWLRTGDLGHMDPTGRLYLVARRGDVILRGGQNVYPAEIERVLLDQPGVADAAVVAAPSAEWGQVPVAFVVAGQDVPSAVSLLAGCAGQLGSYKRPAEIRFVAEIPRNAGGKILRAALKGMLADQSEAEAV
ncbi:MAG: AMP-binding protein [Actinomycetota bacterium]|nr:AMP-binding protein [Actinomycetota bacterium]